MRIFIRHAEKAYRNGHPPKDGLHYYHSQDPPLTERGKAEAEEVARELLARYPPPRYIVTSPYLRARETAAIMASVVVKDKSPKEITITCDRRIGEYLGNHRSNRLDVSPATWRYHPFFPEKWHGFVSRVKDYFTSSDLSDDVVWIITHGVVIQTIDKILTGTNRQIEVPYLGYVVC